MKRLRQVCLVASDLEPTLEGLCTCLGIEVAFRDPGVGIFGLRNAVLPVGDTFLEVVSPIEPGTTAGRYLERRGGDGGYMVLLQSDSLDEDRERLAALGIRTVWSIDLEKIRGTHLHPRDTGGTLLSVDAALPPESWQWAGPAWTEHVRRERVCEITAVDLQSEDPHALAERWARILARHVDGDARGVPTIALDRGRIRFLPLQDDRGEGLYGFEVLATDREALLGAAAELGYARGASDLELAGVRIRVAE